LVGVAEIGVENDGGVFGDSGHKIQKVLQGQPDAIDEIEPVAGRTERQFRLLEGPLFLGRVPGNEVDMADVRKQLPYECQMAAVGKRFAVEARNSSGIEGSVFSRLLVGKKNK
jgi:hypothetical protein